MNLSQAYPDFSEHIAGAIEQLGGISEALLESTEQSASLIASKLLAGGKILLATDVDNRGPGEAFQFDLLERYKQQQPGLPVVQLPYCASSHTESYLRSAEVLGQETDVLLMVNSTDIIFENAQLEQLHLNRGISSIYLGQDLSLIHI